MSCSSGCDTADRSCDSTLIKFYIICSTPAVLICYKIHLIKAPTIVIHQPDNIVDNMNDWCKEHHGKVNMYSTHQYIVSMTVSVYMFIAQIMIHPHSFNPTSQYMVGLVSDSKYQVKLQQICYLCINLYTRI